MKVSNDHVPVLAHECIEALNICKNGIYLDMTAGRGGHMKLISDQLDDNGLVIGFDQDQEAINYLEQNVVKDNIKVIWSNFQDFDQKLDQLNIQKVNGILFDLGVSSPQLDNDYRGFSYINDGPLDMRMNQSQELSAKKVVNEYGVSHLASIFEKYGEVKNPIFVARAIVKARHNNLINTTGELKQIIFDALNAKTKYGDKNPYKQYFQAIRIEVNNELGVFEAALQKSLDYLADKGRLVIITFHSLEEKVVKKFINNYTKNRLPKEIPSNDVIQDFKLIKANLKATVNELSNNKRSKSAKLYILERRM